MDSTWSAVLAAAPLAGMVGVMLSAVQAVYLWRKARRETRQAQARFGYELLDALFDDERASALLYALDDSTRPADRAQELRKSFHDVFGATTNAAAGTGPKSLYEHVDDLLYHFDRFEHAIQAKLTRFDDIQSPPGYYVRLMSACQRGVETYAADVGYERAVAFLRRFESRR